MRRVYTMMLLVFLAINIIQGQDETAKKNKTLIGFNGILPRGLAPSTALTNDGQSINKGYGLGLTIQRKIIGGFSILFDFNTYNYNIFLAAQGKDVQSIWTVAESATHWDEPGATQILYVHDLPTDVHFDMQATGFRLAGKYAFSDKKVRPWVGLGFGFYEWQANYFNPEKDKTYGGDRDFIFGLTYLGGIDFEVMDDIVITAFADMASPVAEYTIEGLFYDQWDITDYQAHIMGPYRFGITLSFAAGGSKKNR